MGWLEKLWNGWEDAGIGADMTAEMPPEHFDLSLESLADLAADLGAHDPRHVARSVKRDLDYANEHPWKYEG